MELVNSFENIHAEAKSIIEVGRKATYQAINTNMVKTYWELGRLMVEEEQKGKSRADYGKYLIVELSKRLVNEYGKGFEKRNLYYMKQFFISYPIVHSLRAQLTWTHYKLLLKLPSLEARSFYENECINGGWNTRALDRQINTFYYERLLASQDKPAISDEATKKVSSINNDVLHFIKDPYVLEFLQVNPHHSLYEKELEQLLIDNLQSFLLELGNGFSFVARQKHIRADDEDYHIDLVFYNYILKCFVLIDLKIDKLSHQDIGQMDMYVRMYEDLYKVTGDNPTIGIILCSEKSEAVVKYSVLKDNEQLFASKYLLYLPSENELKAELERERMLADIKLQSTE